jgi:hypothetical protein
VPAGIPVASAGALSASAAIITSPIVFNWFLIISLDNHFCRGPKRCAKARTMPSP